MWLVHHYFPDMWTKHHSRISTSAQSDLEFLVLPVLNTKCIVVDSCETSWPTRLPVSQKEEFVKKGDWLCFKERLLDCSIYKKWTVLKYRMGMRIAREWVNVEVSSYGENRQHHLSSLRKEILIIKLQSKVNIESKKESLKKCV